MLKKLIKWELIPAWRALKWPVLALWIASFLPSLSFLISGNDSFYDRIGFHVGSVSSFSEFLSVVFLFVWFGLCVAIAVISATLALRSLYGQMFGAQGAFTHTLPLTPWQLAGGKLLGCYLQVFCSILSGLFAFFLLALTCLLTSGELAGIKFGSFAPDLPRVLWLMLQSVLLFMAYLLLLMSAAQFVIIGAQQFGRFKLPAGVVVLVVTLRLIGLIGKTLLPSVSYLATLSLPLVCSALCFGGSVLLLQKRLNLS